MRGYTPRRASVTRWLAGAPDYILDVLDSKGAGDRYTVIFGKQFAYHVDNAGAIKEGPGDFSNTYMQYLGMSGAPTHPQGVSMWGEFKAYDCANYRYRCKHHRIKWMDLPENVREHVIARATAD